mgnify:CR=1 FL=1
MELNEERLAEFLLEAEHAHGEYEKTLGKRDEDCPKWYAQYIVSKLNK